MSRIEESMSKLKRFKYHAIGRLELEDAIDNVVSWYEQMMENAIFGRIIETFNPATEEGEPYLHGITLIYEDKNKSYLAVGDMFKFTIIDEEDEQ